MTKDRETQKKRIVYQSWYRGCKETDRIVGYFAKQEIDNLTDEELDMFDALLLEDDRLLYDILTQQKEVPEHLAGNKIMQYLLDFDYTKATEHMED